MEEEAPPLKRSTRRETAQAAGSSGSGAAAGSTSTGSMAPPSDEWTAQKLAKKIREAERLVVLQTERVLTQPEQEKVGNLQMWRPKLQLLLSTPSGTPSGTPLATPTHRTPGSAASSAPTERAENAGKAAAASNAAHEKLDSLPRSPEARLSTRATAAEVAREQATARAKLKSARDAAAAAASEADAQLRQLLRAPLDVWDEFCDGVHWHNLALVGPERVMYYWEPTGSKLGDRDAISTAFECAAPGGWDIVSIPLRLQADGHSCGDWAHWFRCRVHEYVADETQMGKCTFPEFLRGDLLNLRGLRGTQLTDAESRHRRFARRRRDALRELLRDAARRGALPWGEAQLDAFVPGAQQQERTVVDLNTLDEELDGDRRVMIDLRSPRSREIG